MQKTRVQEADNFKHFDSTEVLTPEFFQPSVGTTLRYRESNYVMDRPDNVFNSIVSKFACSSPNTFDVYPYPKDMPNTIGYMLQLRIANDYVQVRRGNGGTFGDWNRIIKIGAKKGDSWFDKECGCQYRLLEISTEEYPKATIEVMKTTNLNDDVSTSPFPLEPYLGGEGTKYILEFQAGKGLSKCESYFKDQEFGWMKMGTQELIQSE